MIFLAMRGGVTIRGGRFLPAALRGAGHLFGGRGLSHAAGRGRERRQQPLEVSGVARRAGRRRRILGAHERFELMAAGAAANLSANPFASMTTVTFQIVALLTGDQDFNTPKTMSAFALGLVLFVVTLMLNIVALRVVKRFREAYD